VGVVVVVVVVVTVAAGGACGAAPPPCRIAARDVHAAPLLWRVQGPGGAVVWLYGTIHDAGTDDVHPVAWTLLDAAPAFVSELGDAAPDPGKLSALARLPWGQVLDRLLPADDWWDLVNAMLGAMTEDELRHARPWFAMVRLFSHMAKSPRPSMDDALAERARQRGLAVEPLEPWEAQLGALDTSVTAAELSRAIHARHTVACELAGLRSAYRASDLPALTRALVGTAPSEALLGARNRRWLPQIERYLAGGGAFIAVGLGHLLGDDGLPAMLARAGHPVERRTAP
jgi:uncharacterized protein YbaP (TraB family)